MTADDRRTAHDVGGRHSAERKLGRRILRSTQMTRITQVAGFAT
jgi:hypothetical protein